MMVREMDRLVNAELRPINDSTDSPNTPPDSAFLTTRDSRLGDTDADLHYGKSNILFADGHVKLIDCTQLAPQWDPHTKRWYNHINADSKTPKQNALNKTIAITP